METSTPQKVPQIRPKNAPKSTPNPYQKGLAEHSTDGGSVGTYFEVGNSVVYGDQIYTKEYVYGQNVLVEINAEKPGVINISWHTIGLFAAMALAVGLIGLVLYWMVILAEATYNWILNHWQGLAFVLFMIIGGGSASYFHIKNRHDDDLLV